MMKKRITMMALLFGLIVGIVMLVMPPQPVQAATPTQVEVVLHKLLFDDTAPDTQANDGSTQPHFTQSSRPLNGVTFTAYDVTAAFWQKVDAGMSRQRAQTVLAEANYQPARGSRVQSAVTQGLGQATFSQLPLQRGGRYAVYLFRESATPAGITASQNLVVVMPGTSGKAQSRLDLYPKNVQTGGHTTITKTITNGQTSFNYGETIPYQIKVKVPADIGAMTTFAIGDVADAHLQRVGNLTVKLDGRDAAGKYQVTQSSSHAFRLAFDPAKLTGHAGQTLLVTYTMRIKAGTTPDVPLVNQATVYPGGHDPQTDHAVVVTGGKVFEKVDAKTKNKLLPGATFVVRDAAGRYLVKGAHGWIWQAGPAQQAELYQLISDKRGRFAVTGLKAGKYALVEIKAPRGYLRNRKAVAFAVVNGEYTRGQANPYTVVNVHAPSKTVPPGLLPLTGNALAVWLIILGLILVAVLVGFKLKIKKV